MQPDEQERRLRTIALWPRLKTGRWGPTHDRDLDDYGDRPRHHSVATATIPNAARAYARQTLQDPLALIAPYAGAYLILTHDAYMRALDKLTSDEFLAHQHSLTGNRPPPYRMTTVRGGSYARTTEYGWDATWAPAARRALSRVTDAAVVWQHAIPCSTRLTTA